MKVPIPPPGDLIGQNEAINTEDHSRLLTVREIKVKERQKGPKERCDYQKWRCHRPELSSS